MKLEKSTQSDHNLTLGNQNPQKHHQISRKRGYYSGFMAEKLRSSSRPSKPYGSSAKSGRRKERTKKIGGNLI